MSKKETKKGHCPKCGSKNIHYKDLTISEIRRFIDVFDVQDNCVYYPINCNDCDHDAKEWYSLEFIGHTEKLTQNKDDELD